MIALPLELDPLAEELLTVLDQEIESLVLGHHQLKKLRDSILARDDSAMDTLLKKIAHAQQKQASTDARLESIRSSFAKLFDRNRDELKLTDLADLLPERLALAFKRRREQIITLVKKTRQQQLQTSLLLYESARVNRMLLSTIFPQTQPVVTYTQDGQDSWRNGPGLVDSEC